MPVWLSLALVRSIQASPPCESADAGIGVPAISLAGAKTAFFPVIFSIAATAPSGRRGAWTFAARQADGNGLSGARTNERHGRQVARGQRQSVALVLQQYGCYPRPFFGERVR